MVVIKNRQVCPEKFDQWEIIPKGFQLLKGFESSISLHMESYGQFPPKYPPEGRKLPAHAGPAGLGQNPDPAISL